MKKFEYTAVATGQTVGGMHVHGLNDLGALGWEVVTCRLLNGIVYDVLLKREIVDNQSSKKKRGTTSVVTKRFIPSKQNPKPPHDHTVVDAF